MFRQQKKCYDVTLSRQEGVRYTTWRVHGTGIVRPVETQDVSF